MAKYRAKNTNNGHVAFFHDYANAVAYCLGVENKLSDIQNLTASNAQSFAARCDYMRIDSVDTTFM